MFPTQSKGRENGSRHAGLNPLFLTTAVRTLRVRAEDTAFVVALEEGEYVTPAAFVDSGRNGEMVHSGTWSETSTKGSTTDLSIISFPSESRKRGSCCAEIIYGDRLC